MDRIERFGGVFNCKKCLSVHPISILYMCVVMCVYIPSCEPHFIHVCDVHPPSCEPHFIHVCDVHDGFYTLRMYVLVEPSFEFGSIHIQCY
jgi:hypothetical protein